jgi:CRISPR-associated protein Csd2
VTDVALKRKVRDYVAQVMQGQEGYDIYVKHRGILAREQERAYRSVGVGPALRPNEDARQWMCRNYFDIRMFGAVMTTGDSGQKDNSRRSRPTTGRTYYLHGRDSGQKDNSRRSLQWNCGQVRGPVQLKFARSIDPVTALDVSITRVALTNPGDVDRGADSDDSDGQAVSGQMGRKAIVSYGLYRTHGYFTPKQAADTGVTSQDMELFWDALLHMWDLDRSAARGEMACRGVFVFSHEKPLGNAPAHRLLESVQVSQNPGARSFREYRIEAPKPGSLDAFGFPGVTLTYLEP